MKWPVGPIVVTPALASVPVPTGTSGLLIGVALFNNSQYLLKVGAVGEWLQPFSAGWYGPDAMTNNSLPITASPFGSQVNASDGQILTGTFYSSDEAKPDLLPFAADPITAAEALAATGVPSTLLASTLYSNIVNSGAGAAAVISGIGGFGSAVIKTHDTVFGSAIPTNLQLDWYSAIDANGNPVSQPYTEYLTNMAGQALDPSWQVPINGPYLRVTNRAAHPLQVQVFGSNRTIARPVTLGGTYTPRAFNRNGIATANNVPVILVNADGGVDFSSMTGPVYVRGACSGASGGLFGFRWLGPDNNTHDSYFSTAVAAGGQFVGAVDHPLSVVQPIVLPITPFGNTNYSLDLTQG